LSKIVFLFLGYVLDWKAREGFQKKEKKEADSKTEIRI